MSSTVTVTKALEGKKTYMVLGVGALALLDQHFGVNIATQVADSWESIDTGSGQLGSLITLAALYFMKLGQARDAKKSKE